MTLSPDFTTELANAAHKGGFPVSLCLQQATPAATVFVQLDDADRLACCVREVRVAVPHLAGCDFQTLTTWAQALAARLTYLLEDIGPLELDPQSGQVLMRSRTAAAAANGSKAFYEIRLQANADQSFSLSRIENRPGQRRSMSEMQLTNDVAERLIDDVVETIPCP